MAKGFDLGGYLVILEGAYRAWDISGRYDKYQAESKKAAQEGQRLLDEALAELEAALKQAPACLEASRKAAQDEKLLEQAKAQIEAWDSNGFLYRDPITNEALDYRAAVKRALDRLKGSQQGGLRELQRLFSVIAPAHAAEVPVQMIEVTRPQLEAALRDFDRAIGVFERLRGRIYGYLRVEARVHDKLRTLAASLGAK